MTLENACEIAAALESKPMLALGIALMDEEEFRAAAMRAKHVLMNRALRRGQMDGDDWERIWEGGADGQ